MNDNTCVVEWDDMNMKEIEEAKKLYQKARREGRKIVDMAGAVIEGFKASLRGFRIMEKALSSTQFSMRIINDTGDELVVWDSNVKKEIREAGKLFEKYLSDGYKAYAVKDDGSLGGRITKFDADLEEISFSDKQKQSVSRFAESFGKVQMLPKTRKA
jgi:hypothetical protein